MDLRQLRYFCTLAETLNFRRAAERLNMSQPPLTVAIRQLEEDLGVRLFTRTSRSVELTPAGEAALEHAKAALAHANHLRLAARESESGHRGSLAIGFVTSAIYSLLPRLIPAFMQLYPAVDLELQESTSVDIVRRIRERETDVGLVRLPLVDLKDVTVHPVENDELVAAIPEGNPLSRRTILGVSALANERFIIFPRISILYDLILMTCHRAGFTPDIAQQATQVPTILSLVQSGLGIALVPARATRQVPDGVRLIRLEEPVPILMGIALRSVGPSPIARNFCDLAISMLD